MYLSRIHLNQQCKQARKDMSDPYQLHATLCRAFSPPEQKCPSGVFLWRHEIEDRITGLSHILVQSLAIPDWTRIGVQGWLSNADPTIDLRKNLKLDSLKKGQRFRFRLRANPCVTRSGKRLGLLRLDEQELWIERIGSRHGFSLPKLASFDFSDSSPTRIDVHISQERMLRGKRRSGDTISIFSVLYDGILVVTSPDDFQKSLKAGIGHGKSVGLGLLSVVPIK
jgi:CRISPR system Cascade subunit CasE